MEFNITLTPDEILTLCDAINNLPYKTAKPIMENIIIGKFLNQVKAQEEAINVVTKTAVVEEPMVVSEPIEETESTDVSMDDSSSEDNPDEILYVTNSLG